MTEAHCRQAYKEKYDHFKEVFTESQNKANITLFKQLKIIMNGYFGEANNQLIILQPNEVLTHVIENYYVELAIKSKEEIREWVETHKVFGFAIIVYFPEVQISNSSNATHTIKDLYVKVAITGDGLFDTNIYGLRTTFRADEFSSLYVHSHLNSRKDKCEFSAFCLGDGQIGQVLMNLTDTFSIDDFHLFCIHLKNFVAWESLEGSPYKHMEDIRTRRNEARLATRIPSARIRADHMGELLLKKLVSLPVDRFTELFDIDITPIKITVSPTDELREFGAHLIVTHWNEWISITSNMRMGDIVNTRDEDGTYRTCWMPQEVPEDIKVNSRPILVFKGEKKQLKIINDEQEEQEKESGVKKYAHPAIIRRICDYLTTHLTQEAITAKEADINSYTSQDRQDTTSPSVEIGTVDQRQGMVRNVVLQDNGTFRVEELQSIR